MQLLIYKWKRQRVQRQLLNLSKVSFKPGHVPNRCLWVIQFSENDTSWCNSFVLWLSLSESVSGRVRESVWNGDQGCQFLSVNLLHQAASLVIYIYIKYRNPASLSLYNKPLPLSHSIPLCPNSDTPTLTHRHTYSPPQCQGQKTQHFSCKDLRCNSNLQKKFRNERTLMKIWISHHWTSM